MAEWVQGELWPGVVDLVPAYINDKRLAARNFSKREREVTCGMCLGLTYAEIACRISTPTRRVSEPTVKIYALRAINKAQVNNRIELISWAQTPDRPEEHGLRLVV